MSRSELIVMLTQNDYTLENAMAIFESCKHTSAKFWGAKEQGVSHEELLRLFAAMKAAGKQTVLEVVAYDEASCLEGAKLAAECGCDCLLGTAYFDSVHSFCREHQMKYLPFVGAISNRPSVLKGSIEEIVEETACVAGKGVDGIDLLGYRYSCDCQALCHAVCRHAAVPVCLAGSINSYARLQEVKTFSPAFFTIGGAFWDHSFGDDLAASIEAVCHYMND